MEQIMKDKIIKVEKEQIHGQMIKEHEKEAEKKPKRKYLKKEKANKKENTKVKKDKKCTTKFYNSLPKYMIYIKSRFSTRITR